DAVGEAAIELGLELFGAVQPQRGIVDEDGAMRRDLARVVEGGLARAVERRVVVDAAPSLAQVTVGRVELHLRVLPRRIRLRKGVARLEELVRAEVREAGVESRLVDTIDAHRRRQASGYFGQCRGLPHVHAYDR